MSAEIPIPPAHMSARLMHGGRHEDVTSDYLVRGRQTREAVERLLPDDDWDWAGKCVLDFGCGSGRVIRHLPSTASEIWGSDIDPRCIEWNRQHLSASASFVVNGETPPLPFPDGKFDLIYALSVFTHISTHWPAWLLELDRVLAPGGRIVATIMSEGMSEAVAGEPWDERNVGMNVYEEGQSWDRGGPMVLHSPWWIEEHWGRLFEVERLISRGFLGNEVGQDDHGAAVLGKTTATASIDELVRIDPAETREVSAMRHDIQHLRAEVAGLRSI